MIFLQFTVARITNAVPSRNSFIVGLREKYWSHGHKLKMTMLMLKLMSMLTLFNPALFGPFDTQRGVDLPFSLAPGGSHLLKNGLEIKFPQKSSDNDPV